MSDKREELAKYAHEAWSGWMDHLFRHSYHVNDGTYRIPKWAVDRWKRQARTHYENLSDDEKESDRIEADRILKIMERAE